MSPIFCNKGHENPTSSLFCQTCGEKLSPPPSKLMLSVGEVLEGRYKIAQQIGQGGFGRTYLCENLNRFNEPCVLKEFAPQVQGVYALNKAKTLFEREANVLHQLTHPQIPRFRELFQVNSGGGGLFLVQDYVAGPTYRYLLGQRMVKNENFSEAEVRKFLLDVLPVLEYIHSLGVIHRDIAPDNLILRSSDNLPVLIDFGGVKQLAVNAEIQAIGGTDLPTCLGKVGYAPHEQLQRGQTYPHSDLYALAATALVLATGKEPTSLIDPQNLQWNWRNHVTLDPKFGEVLDRMLHPNITARFQTATEALTALRSIGATKGSPIGVPGSNTGVGTVVISPNGQKQQGQPQRGHGPVTAPSSGQGELWPILKRSWLALAGVAVLGTGAWGAYNMISGSKSGTNTTTPTTSPTIVESPASSTAATTSPSPSEQSSSTPESSAASQPPKAATDNNGGASDSAPQTLRERRPNSQSRANTDRSTGSTARRSATPSPKESPKAEIATSSRSAQTEAPKPPKAPTIPQSEVDTSIDREETPNPSSRSRGTTEETPARTQRSRSSSNRPSSSSESNNEPSSTPRRSRTSSSESSSTPRQSRNSGESSAPSRPRRSSTDSDNGGSSPRTARESNNNNSNRSRSSSETPRSSGNSGSSSTKPSEEPLF
jgi:serine/threonine protein kinase